MEIDSATVLQMVNDIAELKVKMSFIIWIGLASVVPGWIGMVKHFWGRRDDSARETMRKPESRGSHLVS